MKKSEMGKGVILFIVTGLVIVCLILFSLIANFFLKTYDSAVDREVHKQSQSYQDGMADDLSAQKREFDLSKNADDRIAIINYIKSTFGEYDLKNIRNDSLRQFAEDVFNGKYDDGGLDE